MSIITKLKEKLINAFYPKHIKCICCKDELIKQNIYDMCDDCYKNLGLINSNYCARCGLQFEMDGTGVCLNCKANNFHFELARSAVTFDDKIIPVIHKFKYARYRFLAEPLSYLLYDRLKLQNWKFDMICYVPLHNTREKQRGYNQSRELANYLSRLTGVEIFHDIERLRDTPTQTKLSRRERQENVKDCFTVTNRPPIKNKNILLIDDVFTTGSTTNEISKELKKFGANKIYVLTVAHAGFKQKY